MLVEQLRRLRSTNCARNNGYIHWLMIVLNEGGLGYPRLGKRLNTLCYVYIDCMDLLGKSMVRCFHLEESQKGFATVREKPMIEFEKV
jgi:hypothetical protein